MPNAKDVLRVLHEQEKEVPTTISLGDIDKIKETLIRFGVKSERSFKGWALNGGISDDSTFLSLNVKEDGFCVAAKSGDYSLQEGEAAQKRLTDIMACLNELNQISPVIIAK
jgi:hypothetical protein